MVIRITGPARVTLADGGPVTARSIILFLDGAESDDACGNYLGQDLADLGIAGGKVRLAYDATHGRFRVGSEYTAPAELNPAQLERLAQETAGQWSDGIGEGCFDGLAERLGVVIDLARHGDRDQGLRAGQVDDGAKPGRPKTALAKAARGGDLAALEKHMEAGADLDARLQGYTPLHWAVLYGRADAALRLIGRGADVHALDPQGQDSLMLAAVSNKMTDADAARIARVLLEYGVPAHGPRRPGANPEHGGYTPLYMARNRRKAELAAVLQSHGAVE